MNKRFTCNDFYKKKLRPRPNVATLLSKIEHAIQKQRFLQGRRSRPDPAPKSTQKRWEKLTLAHQSINFTRRPKLMYHFYEVNFNLVMQRHRKSHEEKSSPPCTKIANIPTQGLRWPKMCSFIVLCGLVRVLHICGRAGRIATLALWLFGGFGGCNVRDFTRVMMAVIPPRRSLK